MGWRRRTVGCVVGDGMIVESSIAVWGMPGGDEGGEEGGGA